MTCFLPTTSRPCAAALDKVSFFWIYPVSALLAEVLLYSLRGDKGMLLDSDQDITELDLGG